jgi:hypothetical protein
MESSCLFKPEVFCVLSSEDKWSVLQYTLLSSPHRTSSCHVVPPLHLVCPSFLLANNLPVTCRQASCSMYRILIKLANRRGRCLQHDSPLFLSGTYVSIKTFRYYIVAVHNKMEWLWTVLMTGILGGYSKCSIYSLFDTPPAYVQMALSLFNSEVSCKISGSHGDEYEGHSLREFCAA